MVSIHKISRCHPQNKASSFLTFKKCGAFWKHLEIQLSHTTQIRMLDIRIVNTHLTFTCIQGDLYIYNTLIHLFPSEGNGFKKEIELLVILVSKSP